MTGKEQKLTYKFIECLKSFPFVKAIWLFGSRARGDHHERSDIDLAILCPGATEKEWHKVMGIIEEADTLLKVDCLRYDHLQEDDLLKKNIDAFKKVLYEKEAEPMEPIFWKDYFNTLGLAVDRLSEVIHHPDVDKNDFMQDATIQRFEFVIELFWKTLKKILAYEKIEATTPRDTLSKSFQYTLIDDEALWLRMLDDRNNTSHVYKQEDARRVFDHIKEYLPTIQKTYKTLKEKYGL